jgi:Uma2 family endonuclease
MYMAVKTRPWTRADLERLPDDGNRYEVLDGVLLVTPQANVPHQRIGGDLFFELERYCRQHGVGKVFAPGAVPRGKSELQPDVMVVPGPIPPDTEKWEQLRLALLVVEVLSESTRGRDLGVKRDAYLRWRIPEYWVVDRHARTVTVVRPDAEDAVVSDVLHWQPRAELPPLQIDLSALFG